MTINNSAKYSFITLVTIITCSFVITFLVNLSISPKNLFLNYLDYLFYVDFIFLIIGSLMLIGQSGGYNSIAYTNKLVMARLSNKYKQEIMASAHIEETEIKQYLVDSVLHRKRHYKHTYHLLVPSFLIFIALIVYAFTY